ncbi:unnamed protein product [Schistosoma mattheei]|uniref:Uncharacterized protein n=1 Tax=Schistosoma mattheei TaxID=31246 RepID=A0A183PK66_9TREM|nr:unnamed protein product [Schistosoma mattheei]
MPPSKLHSCKTKTSNQNITQFKSIDDIDTYSCHSNTDSKSFELTNYQKSKSTQLYYPLKHCKITNHNNNNNDNDLIYKTNLQQDKLNNQIKSQLHTSITKLPKSIIHKQIKFMEHGSE